MLNRTKNIRHQSLSEIVYLFKNPHKYMDRIMFLNFIHEHLFDVPEKEIYNLMRTISKDR